MRQQRLESIATSVVRQTLRQLPANLREAAQTCIIELSSMSECLAVGEADLDPDLLGLFEGSSHSDEPDPTALPRVRLFLDNLWDFTEGHLATFREEVRITLLHELGHYIGLDEEQVAALGLE
ncbi:MAG: metallopeptidase family protein [Verrucomicrobiales bacterium]|nr:metallopeptidase family protein [Verrucomicrobiales bacterium]